MSKTGMRLRPVGAALEPNVQGSPVAIREWLLRGVEEGPHAKEQPDRVGRSSGRRASAFLYPSP
jgi:hypothetical protein